MKILIEEHQYDVARVKDILHGIDALENVEGRVSIHYVGYYYNTLLKDCVFILPKVLLKDVEGQELAFGKYKPEDICDLNKYNPLTPEEKSFLYKFSVWIYRSIVVYKNDKRNADEAKDIVYHTKIAEVGKGNRRLTNTFLDILLELERFNRDNQNFFFFVLKNLHAGFNKINWTRTINKEMALVSRNVPVYLHPVNKKRQINFDEELLVIFFSILNYIGDEYGFPKEINFQYELIKGKQFGCYLNGYGLTRLRQIKYKYFSDKALELWGLCEAFFKESEQLFVHTEKKEYLLVKSFYMVFEAIIDELIGDNPLPDGMEKKQEDGKIVDHLYTAQSLIEGEKKPTYYIGDSKYYKMGHELGSESIYKQYTYARNVIQWNLDIFNGENKKVKTSKVKLRDDMTEGYNIIPNFFISAKMDDGFDYKNDGISQTERQNKRHKQMQFKNRLFDRDTLLLFHYDVNFLFVLSLYARNSASGKAKWKELVRERFRKEIQEWLQEDYNFYAMTARPGTHAKEYFKTHFQEILGKIYTPFAENNIYSLALDKDDPEHDNEALLTELRRHFFVEPCSLGAPPEPVIQTAVSNAGIAAVLPARDLVLVGCLRSPAHREWVFSQGKYNIRLAMGKDDAQGAMKPSRELMDVSHILLYNETDKSVAFYFNVSDPSVMPEMYGVDKMKELFYPFNVSRHPIDSYQDRVIKRYSKRAYLIYDFNPLPIELPSKKVVNLERLLDKYLPDDEPMGKPFVVAFQELLSYIE